nr:hypothetical protein [Tanacetum cinerariifolium]
MMTSSTSSLLSANSPTTNLPLATTTNLPPATSTTTNLPPATSTTSNLLLATSATSHLPPVTSSTSHLLPSISMTRACNINEADLFVVPVVVEENLLIEAEIKEMDDVTMNEDVEANVILEPDKSYIILELVAMFWADKDAKCNYKEFGDIISFDATFQSNKYDMVFVSFTEIDNHLKCMNFGLRMILIEDTEAYTWLLTSFMTAHEMQPTMVVTNQDGAMKREIDAVLTESTHRLCMWHNMQKVPTKICPEIYDETDFKECFGKLVWNMFMKPLEFEGKWTKLVKDFGL